MWSKPELARQTCFELARQTCPEQLDEDRFRVDNYVRFHQTALDVESL